MEKDGRSLRGREGVDRNKNSTLQEVGSGKDNAIEKEARASEERTKWPTILLISKKKGAFRKVKENLPHAIFTALSNK